MSDELMGMPQEYPQEQVQEQPEQEQQQSSSKEKENNLRILAARAEAAERRNQELERMIQNNMSQQHSTKIQLEEEDDFDISDDSYVEGKQLKKYIKSLKKDLSTTKKQWEESIARNAVSNAESRLHSEFKDFNSVVTKENLEKLASQKPALYRSIMASNDIYDRGYSAYEMIKPLLEESYPAVDKRLEDNRNKPRSVANAAPQSSDTPLARVGEYDRRILSEDRKEMLRKQVEEAKRMR